MINNLTPASDEVLDDFDFLNDQYFEGKLPSISIYISDSIEDGFGTTIYEGKTGIPLYMTLSPLVENLSQKYYASVLLHEMAHIAALLNIIGDDEGLCDYKKTKGHNKEWWKIILNLNKKTNKKGNHLFHIVPIIDDALFEEYTKDMILDDDY